MELVDPEKLDLVALEELELEMERVDPEDLELLALEELKMELVDPEKLELEALDLETVLLASEMDLVTLEELVVVVLE